MQILVCNDDGYQAEGLRLLAGAMRRFGEVHVVAPAQNHSGASNSLTLSRPLSVHQAGAGVRFIDGTPTDCVHIALTGLLPVRPDLVVSGINHGPNLGDDVHYSGTVAAAMEGCMLGVPAIAFSLASWEFEHLQTAAWAAETLVAQWIAQPRQQEPGAMLWNVNVPAVPVAQIQGIRRTRLGRRHPSEPVIPMQSPRGDTVYWIGPVGRVKDASDGTDFHAIEQGWVSVTPLQLDLTASAELADQQMPWLSA